MKSFLKKAIHRDAQNKAASKTSAPGSEHSAPAPSQNPAPAQQPPAQDAFTSSAPTPNPTSPSASQPELQKTKDDANANADASVNPTGQLQAPSDPAIAHDHRQYGQQQAVVPAAAPASLDSPVPAPLSAGSNGSGSTTPAITVVEKNVTLKDIPPAATSEDPQSDLNRSAGIYGKDHPIHRMSREEQAELRGRGVNPAVVAEQEARSK